MGLELPGGSTTEHELNLIKDVLLSYDNAGSFLEVGCHTGRLIYYLHMFCPNWKYTGVDPWDEIVMWVANDISTSIEKVQKEFGVSVRHCNTNYRLVSVVSFYNLKQAKEINEYIVKNKLGTSITEEFFKSNCPFANSYKMKFENYKSTEKFDVISFGAIGSRLDCTLLFKKAKLYLKPDGVFIGRFFNSANYGLKIRTALETLNWKPEVIDEETGAFIVRNL
tara:strand:+ start:250 stop:918 length:669 start_codon:yes stop_codon:yes gene_type:complete